MGRVARYVSQEMTPVATDTFKYAVGETKDAVRDLAGAVGDGLGLRGPAAGATAVRCGRCQRENDADARFCATCGAPIAQTAPCPRCGHANKPGNRFCDQCGGELAR